MALPLPCSNRFPTIGSQPLLKKRFPTLPKPMWIPERQKSKHLFTWQFSSSPHAVTTQHRKAWMAFFPATILTKEPWQLLCFGPDLSTSFAWNQSNMWLQIIVPKSRRDMKGLNNWFVLNCLPHTHPLCARLCLYYFVLMPFSLPYPSFLWLAMSIYSHQSRVPREHT